VGSFWLEIRCRMSLDALDITPRRVAIIDAATDRLEELLNGTPHMNRHAVILRIAIYDEVFRRL
jgi:hypothetical protein